MVDYPYPDEDDRRDDDRRDRPNYDRVRPVRDLVTDEECYRCMQFLDEIAPEYGPAYADQDFCVHKLRTVEGISYQLSDERAAQAKSMDARTSPAYSAAALELRNAQARFKTLDLQRIAAQTRIDVWRTIHADKRQREVPEPGRR